MRITTASLSASAIPCVDIALSRNVSHVTHETRTPWDWILRLPPLNVCVDAAFTVTGFFLLPLLYRTFRHRGPNTSRESALHRNDLFSLISLPVFPNVIRAADETPTSGPRMLQRALLVMIGSRFYTCMFAVLWLWASAGARG